MTDRLDTNSEPRASDSELASIVRRFEKARVLIIGDIILDRYVVGGVQRLSPEAPIPILRPASHRSTLGGSANVALNIATLGGTATLIGVIGDDDAGRAVTDLVSGTPRIVAGMIVAAGRPTTSKTRFMAGVTVMLIFSADEDMVG